MTFIHQQDAFERLKILREEYLVEKRKVIEARKKERREIKKSFYKIDPDCIDAGRHISEFELHLDMTLSFAEKGIKYECFHLTGRILGHDGGLIGVSFWIEGLRRDCCF